MAMKSQVLPELLAYFHRALEEEIGIRIETTAPVDLRTKLYAARKADGDPSLDDIIIFAPASGDCLFLAKKMVELEA